jgi:hypothetical protein
MAQEIYKFVIYLDQNNKNIKYEEVLYRTIKVVAHTVEEAIKLSKDSNIFKHPYNPTEEVIRAITEVSDQDNPLKVSVGVI